MTPMISRLDFENVVQISKHCDYEVLQEYILERQNLDMLGLLGNCFYVNVIDNLTNADYSDLLDGSKFQVECNGETKTLVHFGLKRVLIHYSYAAYVFRKGFVDTPFSVVIKQSEDSVPVSQTDLKTLHNEHRTIAFNYWKMTLEYLCANKDTFTEFDEDLCEGCESCKNDCECGKSSCLKCKGGKPNSTRNNKVRLISK